ncbi:MAG: GGDEF domain-containing protein [Candidatus Sphingomonas colombiensis]|nr:GGDEF domain-containing protein [Sphingomonas sp.]WEK44058.1 MAG: GGDEF domain-containing protein [Sphingomonas sp.]
MELNTILGFLILADLLAVALCLGCAWRRGEAKARDFAGAWFVPMATLAFIQLVDVDDGFWGGGSKLLILLAATWQTLWLSGAATRRLGRLRIERDRARAAEIQARELARRDALTGLRNRRGFVESVAPLLVHAEENGLPAAFLLVDIDRFKAINDVYGHNAGDAVLRQVGRRIAAWEGAMCTVGRIGGEEFGLFTIGLEGVVLRRFAESVRLGIAACDHRDAIGAQSVTASIGVAETARATDFQRLFKLADEALYDAKRLGRDQVASRREEAAKAPPAEPRGRSERPASRSGR